MPQTSANHNTPTTHNITTESIMAEKVKLDTVKPPHHKLKQNVKTKFAELLKEYGSQFVQDETTIGTTPLTEITINTGTSITKAIPNENLQRGQRQNKQTLDGKGNMR